MEESMSYISKDPDPIKKVITFAFQSWNKDFDYFNPNTHPEDNIINGVRSVPLTHGGQYFTWESMNYDYGKTISENTYDDLILKGAQATKEDYLRKLVTSKLLKDIPPGEKYIYPVCVHQVSYFQLNKDIGFDFVSPRVIQDVKNNIAKIVLLFPHEGHTGMFNGRQVNNGAVLLDEWCKKAGLSKNQVYFISGNLLADEINKQVTNYTSMSLDAFTTWVPREYMNEASNLTVPKFKPIDDKYLYLCYNRTNRTHRRILFGNLYQKNLMNLGLLSYGEKLRVDSVTYEFERLNQQHLIETAAPLDALTPITIDMDLFRNNPAIDIQRDHYHRTFISVIPETHYEDGILFRSEKIWKTLAAGHPFMVISCKGFLKSLKQLGYRTFDKWIDESYDNEDNWIRRIEMITDEVKRLSTLSIEKLTQMRDEMDKDINYNQRLFKLHNHRDIQTDGHYQLYSKVKRIWDSF